MSAPVPARPSDAPAAGRPDEPADPAGPPTTGALPQEVAVDAAAPAVARADPDAWAAGLQDLLAARLDGPGGPPLLPLPGGAGDDALRADAARATSGPAAGAVLLLPTSGSTGPPRLVPLGGDAVRAGARGGEVALGGPAHWLLALPLGHVAGWNVLARGAVAGTPPTALVPGASFGATAFVAAADRLLARAAGAPARTALVPTQLLRLLDDPAARRTLGALDAVLLGGAVAPPSLLAAASDAGVRVVRSYGATETCGGCVYDGVPLPGVQVRLEDDGRVLLGGDVVALDRPVTGGTRWVRTADAGRWRPDPDAPGGRRLEVLGRLDDVVVTGGEKVAPAAVEAVLADAPGVREVLVVGVPDDRWGAAVVAVVVPTGGAAAVPPDLADLRARAAAALGRAAAPQRLVVVADLPRRALGKPDRRAAAALAAAAGDGGASTAGPAGGAPDAG